MILGQSRSPAGRVVDIMMLVAVPLVVIGLFAISPEGALWLTGALVLLVFAVVTHAVGWTDRLRSPLVPLAVGIALAGFAFQRKAGYQVGEIIFFIYIIPYILGWYLLRIVIYRDRIVWCMRDGVIAIWLLWVGFHLFVGLGSGADVILAINDVKSLGMFVFYFPVKELCIRYERGSAWVGGGILFMAVVALARNLLLTQDALASADAVWQIARVRVTANEMTMTSGVLLCAAWVARGKRGVGLLAAVVGFAALTVGVVIAQWRAYYITLALGLCLLALLASWRGRIRLGLVLIVALVLGAAMFYVVIGDSAQLIAIGMLDRLLSIGTATQVDVSFLNRLWETRAVMKHVLDNPILGYGLGTTFGFFDLISEFTWVKSYAHNGYASMWFKLGGVGLVLFVVFWGFVLRDGWRACRTLTAVTWGHTGMIAGVVMLTALIPSFWVSAPFGSPDTSMCFALLTGLVAGTADRIQMSPALP